MSGGTPNDWQTLYRQQCERSEREDLVMFINACFAATGQTEYYHDASLGSFSINFLHRYVMANYRTVYGRALAARINDFNQSTIIVNLLRGGAPMNTADRAEEGELIARALGGLPANRAYAVLQRLADQKVNNRRTRAVIKRFMNSRQERPFDAIKYRNKFRKAASHSHLELDVETHSFLFDLKRQTHFDTPLYDSFRRAAYTKAAVYELPMTVAESFAQRHKIKPEDFLRNIQPKMTAAEKLRYQNASNRTKGIAIQLDLGRAPLTKLAIFILSLPVQERRQRLTELDQAMQSAAQRTLRTNPLRLGRVVSVLDRSRSAFGSRQKRRRPLAIAVATDYLLRAACDHYRSIWTGSDSDQTVPDHVLMTEASGQSDLAGPIVNAYQSNPDQIIVVSDGYENDPPAAADQIVRAAKRRFNRLADVPVIHANPVFDPQHFSPRRLGDSIITIGLRSAEDLPTMLGFARFAGGNASQLELEDYLGDLSSKLIADSLQRTTTFETKSTLS